MGARAQSHHVGVLTFFILGLAEKHRSEKLGVSRNSLPFGTRRMDDLQPGEWFREKCGFQDLHFSAIEGWKRVIGLN